MVSCKEQPLPAKIAIESPIAKKDTLSEEALKQWHHLDIVQDSIPGISLARTFEELVPAKKGEEVVVAIIDMKVDINHPELKDNIWVNKGEIAANSIDDDNNGYIDDVNGWNFLGAQKYPLYEAVRIVNAFEGHFSELGPDSIEVKQSADYLTYKKAKAFVANQRAREESMIPLAESLISNYKAGLEALAPYYSEEEFTLKRLDSLAELHPELKDTIIRARRVKSYDYDLAFLENELKKVENKLKFNLNTEYNDRILVGDDSKDPTVKGYGNNDFTEDLDLLYHGTLVSGVLAAKRDGVGVEGFGPTIKIMPLAVAATGDEHDKDIALAIRYAVDMGARIINLSFSKEFSQNPEWILEAIKYAAENNVLVVKSAANLGLDLDDPENENYPDDRDVNGLEAVANFIKVGASTYHIDENLAYKNSNYGATQVDIFAPGSDIYSTASNDDTGYSTGSGTSYSAPMVSGIAALIWSYYPDIPAADLKTIILESGIAFDFEIPKPTKEDDQRTIPFKNMSRSGSVVNAYNAFILAMEYDRAH